MRFEHGRSTFAGAVENSKRLFAAAAEAGVERVIHISITNPSAASPLPYFSGKAAVEQALAESGLSHGILRPAVFFGGRDVLVNNIAWLLRRLAGDYGLRPIHIDDLSWLAVAQGALRTNATIDAVGPETFGFRELVQLVRDSIGSRSRIVTMPPRAVLLAGSLLRPFVGDIALTPDEIRGLRTNLLVTDGEPTGSTRLSSWLDVHSDTVGLEWASEIGRHFR